MKTLLVLLPLLLLATVGSRTLPAQVVREGPEPNDHARAPTLLPCGAQAEGVIASATDVDDFAVVRASPTFLAAWTAPGAAAPIGAVSLELRDAQGRLLLAAAGGGRRGPYAALEAGLVPGTFHVRVRGTNGAVGAYVLDVRGGTVPPLVIEAVEPNGSPAAGGGPTMATVDAYCDGTIATPTDGDWFAVHPRVSMLLAAEVDPTSGALLAGTVLRLWTHGPAGVPVLAAQATGSPRARLEAVVEPAGAWFEVAAPNGASGTYLLSIRSKAVVGAVANGCRGSAGVAWLDVPRGPAGEALELPVLGSTFVIEGGGAPAGAAVLRMAGFQPAPVWLPLHSYSSTCSLGVDPLAYDLVFADHSGRHRLPVQLPADVGWRGRQITVQAASLDVAADTIAAVLSGVFHATCGTTW